MVRLHSHQRLDQIKVLHFCFWRGERQEHREGIAVCFLFHDTERQGLCVLYLVMLRSAGGFVISACSIHSKVSHQLSAEWF